MAQRPPVCDYEGSDYQQTFWDTGQRAYEDLSEARAYASRLVHEPDACLRIGTVDCQDRGVRHNSACGGLDPSCSLGGGMESMGMTDADGRVTLQLTSGFFGYFSVDAGSMFYPMVVMWSQPTYRGVMRTPTHSKGDGLGFLHLAHPPKNGGSRV